MKNISVIIPTWNEEGNIRRLIERFDKTFKTHEIGYELIFIDDHSTDHTQKMIKKYSLRFPVKLYIKKGKQGKAYSILEGFDYAKYSLTAIIDADLQYPPEVIPRMIKKIERGLDVVVAKRTHHQTGFVRNLISRFFHLFFAKQLHGFSVDVQSGLKVFRSEIVKRFGLNPSPWTFDLEFLLKAKNAGYKIGGEEIIFSKRFYGKSKVNILKTSFEIGLSSLRLKFTPPQVIPLLPEKAKREGQGFHYKGAIYKTFTDLSQEQSALFRMNHEQKIILFSIFFLVLTSFLINWHFTVISLVTIFTVIYFSDLLFNFYLIYRSLAIIPEVQIKDREIGKERDWPKYTILCPLYKEWEVVPQFVTAMSNLDYPKNNLQIMLLLESDDWETIAKVKSFDLPYYFQTVIVPDSYPKTKPKACNYGLRFATGELCVIYDAEDIPDPDQLKKVVRAFEKVSSDISCIQAKLNFYNPHQNILTRVFTGEYSLWFDLILPGLQSLSAPIPLGGTSNHFRTKDLQKLQGWDPFNVTEDCDLGIRLTKMGSHTAIVNSNTMEEANSSFINWFPQRIRWIKGYIQTYLVHMRSPKHFIKGAGLGNFLIFQITVGGKILSMFINPFMWITTAIYFIFRPIAGNLIESFFLTPIFYMAVLSLIFGNFLYLYNYMIGCIKKGHFDLVKYSYLVPVYWIAMSIAAWIALFKIIHKPHYWAKTPHGLHLNNKKVKVVTQQNLGKSLQEKRIVEKALAI